MASSSRRTSAGPPPNSSAIGLGAGRGALFVRAANPFVAFFPGKRVGEFAPRRVGEDIVSHAAAVRRIGVLAVEGGDAHGLSRDEGRVDELRRIRDAGHPPCRVNQRNKPVGFAAAEGSVEPEYRGNGRAGASNPSADVGEQALQTARRVRIGKEAIGLGILLRPPATPQDVREIGRKVTVAGRAREYVEAWLTEIEDRRNGHSWLCPACMS